MNRRELFAGLLAAIVVPVALAVKSKPITQLHPQDISALCAEEAIAAIRRIMEQVPSWPAGRVHIHEMDAPEFGDYIIHYRA